MKLLVEANNILSLFTGSSRDIRGMRNRVIWHNEFENESAAYDFLPPSQRRGGMQSFHLIRLRRIQERPEAILSGMMSKASPTISLSYMATNQVWLIQSNRF
jgi:hypothetical protein